MKSALYIRVSTMYQIDKDSLPMQREDLINYSKYVLGIHDFEVFEDAGYSGKDTDRPAFQSMMERVRKKEFTHIIVWKLDRVSRNLLDFASMYEEIKRYGVTFVSKNEQFDTSSAMGEAMLKIILVFAELERKLTAERVYATMLSRASKGLFNGGKIPIGYKQLEKKDFPVIDEAEAPTIRLIYDLYEKTESTNDVCEYLHKNSIPTKRGGTWTSKTVGDILRSPFYKGEYRYNYKLSARGKKKSEDNWIVIPDTHEPIISQEQWERVNKILDRNATRNTAKFRVNKNIHLFSGLLTCDHCGAKMIAVKDKPRKDGYSPSQYRCGNRARRLPCDSTKVTGDLRVAPVVFQSIGDIAKGKKVKTKPDIVEYKLENKVIEVSYDFIQKEKERYKRALERLNTLYLYSDDAMSEKDYILQKLEIEDKIKELEKKKPASKVVDDDFLKLASYFMINNEFLNRRKIDYRLIVDNIDKAVLKEFLDTIIRDIKIREGVVISITYANGMTVMFT